MGTGVTVVSESRTIPVAQAGQFEIVTQIIDLQPGAATPPHVHTGPATVVVIDGEVTNCTATTQQVYRAGESFTERPNLIGQVVNTGSAVARFAMIMITPRNLPPMVVVPVITATPGTR
jgi:quercetin dioxygenase-like cupin family protein